MRNRIFILLLVVVTGLKSQNLNDTTICNALIAKIEFEPNQKLTEKYNEELLVVAQKNHFNKYLAAAYNNKGALLAYKGDIIGALEYLTLALKMQKTINKRVDVANTLNNIGEIYLQMKDFKKAVLYYNESLEIQRSIGDKKEISFTLFLIGKSYINFDIEKSLKYVNEAIKIQREISDVEGECQSLNTIAFAQEKLGNYESALEKYLKCLDMFKSLNNRKGVATIQNNIARIYFIQNKYQKALDYSLLSLSASKEIGNPWGIKSSAGALKDIYTKQNKPAQALEMYELFIKMRDSLNNDQTRKALIQKQYQIEYEKKALADSLRANDERKIATLEIEKQQSQKIGLYVVLALVIVFSGFVFNRYKVTQKQKHIITEQKHLVDEKHKEITDSINYAERIQRSFLATKELLNENLKQYFVLFKPKDVVSGDFYWATKLSNGNFLLATADSTGHGVPGAIMSILNISSLEKAVIQGLLEPAEIFNHTRNTIIERLKKDGSENGGKDGMDCSLISFDFENSKLTYAAANNPIWIVRGNILIELDADKMPVGKHDRDGASFMQQEIKLETGDIVYTLTDGMPDQFGGPKGKKFMYKRLKELLVSIAHQTMQEQKEVLEAALNDWKGDLEQVDDICLIGVRV